MQEETLKDQGQLISLGKKLANLRIQKGLSTEEISRQIHVRIPVIEAIENDQPVNVPAVFLKGYIKNYAALVELPATEYQAYLDSLEHQRPAQVMKNYSNKEQTKRHGKRLFFVSLLIILAIIGAISFFAWKDSKSELVEVTHYISQPASTNS